jgi:alpha-tubulin suppressor-like RCC1 family protein
MDPPPHPRANKYPNYDFDDHAWHPEVIDDFDAQFNDFEEKRWYGKAKDVKDEEASAPVEMEEEESEGELELERSNLFCFGRNDHGQLGLGHNRSISRPQEMRWSAARKVKIVSCGSLHTAIVTEGPREFYTVGNNRYGQLGIGHTTSSFEPAPLREFRGKEITHVTCGAFFTLVATAKKRVWAFGQNERGQLGLKDTCDRMKPEKVLTFPCGKKVAVASMAAGDKHSIVLTESGSVFTFGYNWCGQLGLGNRVDRAVPCEMIEGTV